jgi:hypothetical protein
MRNCINPYDVPRVMLAMSSNEKPRHFVQFTSLLTKMLGPCNMDYGIGLSSHRTWLKGNVVISSPA